WRPSGPSPSCARRTSQPSGPGAADPDSRKSAVFQVAGAGPNSGGAVTGGIAIARAGPHYPFPGSRRTFMQQPHATTILCVQRHGQVALGGDGQVSLGETVM